MSVRYYYGDQELKHLESGTVEVDSTMDVVPVPMPTGYPDMTFTFTEVSGGNCNWEGIFYPYNESRRRVLEGID
ncbi:MAG: hypothetical protein V3W44_10945 [Dehalococcoidales bacterium]